jgi:hypothetical protein
MNEALKILKGKIQLEGKWSGEYCIHHNSSEIYLCSKHHCTEYYLSRNFDGDVIRVDSCEVIEICNGGRRCGECDINYLNAKTKGKISHWINVVKKNAEERMNK